MLHNIFFRYSPDSIDLYSAVYDSIVLDINICLMDYVIDDGYVPLNRKDMAVDRMIQKITSIHKNPGGIGYG